MLATLEQVLQQARLEKYAVGAFNITTPLCLSPIIKAAEKQRSPVIINIAEVSFTDTDLDRLYPAIIHSAREASVPVVVNLDHGVSEDAIYKALRYGFSSIMFDASAYSYDENIKKTAQYARMCHGLGISLEGELGVIGGAEGDTENEAHGGQFTDPLVVKQYVQQTKVDALAVSIGNAHGFYRGEPEIQFDLLSQIAKQTEIPLVLHGGSGISDEDFRRAISLGIAKINFYTGLSVAAHQGLTEFLKETGGDYQDLSKIGWTLMDAYQEAVEERMVVFKSAGRG